MQKTAHGTLGKGMSSLNLMAQADTATAILETGSEVMPDGEKAGPEIVVDRATPELATV